LINTPLPALRELAGRAIRVRDIVGQPLWSVRPRQSSSEAAAELAAREFDVAAVADDPIRRYVTLERLRASHGTVATVATPILATEIVSADLPLDDLFSVLAVRSEAFVLEGDRIASVVTRSDLQSPAVSVVVLAHLLALEAALSDLLLAHFGTAILDHLTPERRDRAMKLWTDKTAQNVQIGIGECLHFPDWLYLARRSPDLLTALKTTPAELQKRTSRFVQIRNDLAHGHTILDGRDATTAITLFRDIRALAEELWDLVGQRREPWTAYAKTTISRRGRGRRPLAGLKASSQWPWTEPVHVITAWNPSSIIRPDSANRKANTELEALLRERGIDPEPVVAWSDDRTWSEESLLVAGLNRRDSCQLGQRFGQLAVFELDGAEVVVVRSSNGAVVDRLPRRR
jgi:hypothetical protein